MLDVKFHALAIPKNPKLRTIRDLRKEHLPMLKNIMAQSVSIVILICVDKILLLVESYRD